MIRIELIDLMHQGVAGAIGAWAIQGPTGWVLIESGPASAWDAIEAGLGALDIDPADLAAVLVTHIHLDHSGGAWQFAKRGVPIYVHAVGAPHLIDSDRLESSARRIFGERFESLWGAVEPCDASLVHATRDGDIVEAAGMRLQAIDTPGHALHHHAWHLLDGDAGDLFTGDAAVMRVPGTSWLTIPMPPPEFDLPAWSRTLDLLESGPWTRFRLTHGGTVEDIPGHLNQVRQSMHEQVGWIRQSGDLDRPARIEAYRDMLWTAAQAHRVPRALFDAHVTAGLMTMNLNGVDRWLGRG